MSQGGLKVHGMGVVSPAGWGLEPFRHAVAEGTGLASEQITSPNGRSYTVRRVPPHANLRSLLSPPRLRRSGRITHFAYAAAREALGASVNGGPGGERLSMVMCVMAGCVEYTRRFYEEVLSDPPTASPMLFPETVFNAPASHLASTLGIHGMVETLLGDDAVFLNGISLATEWIESGASDSVLIVAAEESDWISAHAASCFRRSPILAEGAVALWIGRDMGKGNPVTLKNVTRPGFYTGAHSRSLAVLRMREELDPDYRNPNRVPERSQLLVDGCGGWPDSVRAEGEAWRDWRGERCSPRAILGEGLSISGGWQCAAAIEAVGSGRTTEALVSLVGAQYQVIGARWARS